MPYKNPERQKEYFRQYYADHREGDKESRRKRYTEHREEVLAQKHEYYVTNREKRLAYMRDYRAQHLDQENQRAHQWNKEHPDEAAKMKHDYYLEHRAEMANKAREWNNQHPEKRAEHFQRRRSRKASVVSTLTADEIRLMKQAGCFFADSTCRGTLSIAHDIPLSKGGNTTRGNTFILCVKHNSEMRTKSLSEMLLQKTLI